LDASSVQTAPDGYRRIVWMINRMITQVRQPAGVGPRSLPRSLLPREDGAAAGSNRGWRHGLQMGATS
jgi:hypothetical protein